jgi:UDP-N-acetylglucosamine transferase subunit ALG13
VILLAVGTQEPFDRLVRAVDQWVGESGHALFGQLGRVGPESYRPANFPWAPLLPAADFEARFAAAPLVIAHAGMGAIIAALSAAKPLVIMPRRASLGEHRNEHQLATVEKFRERPGIFVADDETMLAETLARALKAGTGSEALSPWAQPELLEAVRSFIYQGR